MEEWLRSWTWESHIQTQVQILVLPLTLVSLNYFISHWAGLLHLYSLYLNTTYLHGVLLKNLRWWIQSTKHSFRYKSSMQWEPLCYDYLFQKEEINDYESTLVLYSILHLSTPCEEKLMAGISIYPHHGGRSWNVHTRASLSFGTLLPIRNLYMPVIHWTERYSWLKHYWKQTCN